MRIVAVHTYSPEEQLYRIGRIVWTRGHVGDGQGYSCKLSLGVQKRFPFLRVRFHKSFGGLYT